MKIDIIVPTYNRLHDIQTFINKIESQDYDNYKVYIIDDCSDYDIQSIVPNNDKFIFVRLNENKGQAYARNYAVSISSGDILVFMDDDAYFLSNSALSNLVMYFNQNDVSGVMFNIKEPQRDWLAVRKKLNDQEEITGFIACGCAFLREEFEKTKGFQKHFHSYGEETDISMSIIRNSGTIIFAKNIELFHNYNPSDRSIEWIKRFKTNSVRNDLIIVLSRYPFLLIIPFYIGKILGHLRYTLLYDNNKPVNFKCIFQGIYQSISFSNKVERASLSYAQFRYWSKNRL